MTRSRAMATYSDCPTTGGGGRGADGGRAGGAGGGGRGGGTSGPSLPQHMNAEFTILLGRKLSALEIRDFLSASSSPYRWPT